MTGMKNSVKYRFDSMAMNTVCRAHLVQGYSICLMAFALVRMPKRKNIHILPAQCFEPIRVER
jgi:hypothetical protein